MVQGYSQKSSWSPDWWRSCDWPWGKNKPIDQPQTVSKSDNDNPVRIWIDIRINNGLHLSQKNLSYRDLVRMVEKLEGLCWVLPASIIFIMFVTLPICVVSTVVCCLSFASDFTGSQVMKMSFRKLTTQRNNSFHYGSDAGAEMAATYHSVIGTVKLHGSSIWNFIGTFFKNIFNGCRDYVNVVSGKITLATGQC